MVLPTIGSDSFPRTKRFDMKERLALVHNAKRRTTGVRARLSVPFLTGGTTFGTIRAHAARLRGDRTDRSTLPSPFAAGRRRRARGANRGEGRPRAGGGGVRQVRRAPPRSRERATPEMSAAGASGRRRLTSDDRDPPFPLDRPRRRRHDLMATQFDKKLILLEQERRQIRADLEKNVAAFRAEYQVRAHPPPASTPAPRRPDLGDVSFRLLGPPPSPRAHPFGSPSIPTPPPPSNYYPRGARRRRSTAASTT